MKRSDFNSAAQIPGSSLTRRALLQGAAVAGAATLVGATAGLAYFTDDPMGNLNEALMRLRNSPSGGESCSHLDQIQTVNPSAAGCEECLKTGDSWVHLRMCLVCGHVGCCDDSMNTYATKHFHATGHPIMQSVEPGEDWRWCFVDQRMV